MYSGSAEMTLNGPKLKMLLNFPEISQLITNSYVNGRFSSVIKKLNPKRFKHFVSNVMPVIKLE